MTCNYSLKLPWIWLRCGEIILQRIWESNRIESNQEKTTANRLQIIINLLSVEWVSVCRRQWANIMLQYLSEIIDPLPPQSAMGNLITSPNCSFPRRQSFPIVFHTEPSECIWIAWVEWNVRRMRWLSKRRGEERSFKSDQSTSIHLKCYYTKW